jgi:two-component system OmpR family response regulator
MRLLVVEDDAETAGYVIRGLREHGHVADHAKDGYDGLMLAGDGNYDVLVIDRMLPKLDGLALLKTLREGGVKTPALFLTAIGSVEDRVRGLEVGDDYLVKPFAFAELYARIRSLSRRPPLEAPETMLCVADLEVDLLRRRVARAGQPVALLPTEFRLLEYLLRHAGRVVTRTMLLESVWGFHFEPKTSVVETHISRLRAKIDRGFDGEVIKTVRGSGYIIDVD